MLDLNNFLSADAQVMRSNIIRQHMYLLNRPDIISFAGGSPNPETFPHQQLAEIFQELVEREKGKAFQYSVTRGITELLDLVGSFLKEKKHIRSTSEEIILVSGSQQGLDLVGRVLLDPGDVVFVELPNYIGANASFQNLRAELVGINKQADGMDLEDLQREIRKTRTAGKKAKLIYVIPNFQNPSGHTWSQAKRQSLLELATRESLFVFEDDAYGEVYFSRANPQQLAPIKALDTEGHVIYLSTFSKILVPGLRLAWIAAHRDLVRRIEYAKETADLCSTTLGQKLILEYFRRGWMEPHLAEIRSFYERRCNAMQQSLERHLSSLARWNRPLGGLFLWVELLAKVDTLRLLSQAVEQQKVAYIPGSPFYVDGSGRNTLRLSFSNESEERIEEGISRLGRCLQHSA